MNVKKIKNLALCGGGFFGYASVGVLRALEDYKEYLDIKKIIGASVGSMVGALYAVGYNPEELTKIIFEMDFDKLIKDTRFTYINLYDKYGLHDAKLLEDEIERLIQEKTHIKGCTFSQVKIDLTIIATNLNYQRPQLFNKENTPDMVISKAVRMSIGYPMYMTPVQYNGDLFSDGGLYINYPIILFDNVLDETIGVTFVSHNEDCTGKLKTRVEIKSIYDCIESTAMSMARATYTSQITQGHLERSIVVHINENISPMQFNLNMDQKHYLYNCGVKAVNEQFHKILKISPKENIETHEFTINGSVSTENKSENELENAMDQILYSVAEIEKTLEDIEF